MESVASRKRCARFGSRCAAGLLLVALLPGCTDNRATASALPGADPVVRRGTFEHRFLLTGELKAVEARNIIVPRTPSWQLAIRWMAADGQQVKTGDKLLELDNSQFVGDLEQKRLGEAKTVNELAQKAAEVAVQAADREFRVEEARTALRKAEMEAAVPPELRPRREHQEKQLALERAKVALQKAVEDRDSYTDSSQAELEVLRIELRKARREIETAERAIEALTVEAPADGIVIVSDNWREGRKWQVGDNVWVGLPVMRMPDLSRMRVEVKLSDVDDGKVTPGMRATSVLDTYPELEFTGRVTEIAPIAQVYGRRSQRRAFRASVLLDSADPERMRPGMSVRVEVDTLALDDVLLVPRGALDLTVDPPVARLAGGGTSEVELGPCNALECVVESGLGEGNRVEVSG